MWTPTLFKPNCATPAMIKNTLLPFSLPYAPRKKVIATFDRWRLTSDGGVMLLGSVVKSLGTVEKLAKLIADPRDSRFIAHTIVDILRTRILAIACGYGAGGDLDRRWGRQIEPPTASIQEF